MSESLTALYLSNPALASALRRQQYGQQLAQTGTDTSPTGWAGALARLANAYVGAREVGKADTDIKSLGDAQTARDEGLMATARGMLGGGQQPMGTAPAPVPLPQSPGAGAPPGASSEALPPIGASPASAPPELMAHYEAASRETGIPVAVLVAKDKQESGFNNALRGKAGEYGISQILPSTAAQPGYGIPPATPEELADPGKNILFGARILKAFGTRSGVTDWNDPAQVSAAYKAYNGGGDPNYVANVSRYLPAGYGGSRGVQVASNTPSGTATDAGAPAPGASASPGQSPLVAAYLPQPAPQQAPPQQPGPQQPTANPQPGGDPLKNARAYQDLGLQMMRSPNPITRAQGQQFMQMGTQMLTVGKFVPDTVGGVPGQRNAVTNEWKPMISGTGRPATDVHGNLLELPPGGGPPRVISPNPSGVSGNSPEANAMRLMAELGPKVQGGTATPQERANYAVAAATYQQFKSNTTTPGQETAIVPGRPLPAGMPDPAAAPTGVAPNPNGTGSPNAPPPTAAAPGGAMVTKPADINKVAAQAQAQSQGAESGKQAALTGDRMVRLGTESAQGLGTIDSALTQVRDAAKGGITAGYFAPWVATAAAAGKSLGINLDPVNVDPSAVSNVQAARKSLALVSGSILRNILGPDTPITDAKLGQYIHATPGIETDPAALEKILGWARSQFVFNHDMAMDAMRAADPQTGMVPPGWQAQFFRQKGSFGPIYNPLSGEMAQPKGQGPAAEPPAPTPKAEVPAATLPPEAVKALAPGKVVTFGNGQQWTLGADGQPKRVK